MADGQKVDSQCHQAPAHCQFLPPRTISASTQVQGGDINLYENMRCHGVPLVTISRGRVVYENGVFMCAEGTGKFCPLRSFPDSVYKKLVQREKVWGWCWLALVLCWREGKGCTVPGCWRGHKRDSDHCGVSGMGQRCLVLRGVDLYHLVRCHVSSVLVPSWSVAWTECSCYAQLG